MIASIRIPTWLWGTYILAGLANIRAEFFGHPQGILLSKPLLMPILILIVLCTSVDDKTKPLTKFLVPALVFSWLGDMMLLMSGIYNKHGLFLVGIAGFLIAHLFYITIFWKYKRKDSIHLAKSTMLIFFWIGFNYFIHAHLDFALKIAVPLYSLVICLMVYQAWTTSGHVAKKRFYWISVGAFLFFFSDLILALHNFLDWDVSFVPLRVWIMLTYIIAQGFICRGILMKIPALTHH